MYIILYSRLNPTQTQHANMNCYPLVLSLKALIQGIPQDSSLPVRLQRHKIVKEDPNPTVKG